MTLYRVSRWMCIRGWRTLEDSKYVYFGMSVRNVEIVYGEWGRGVSEWEWYVMNWNGVWSLGICMLAYTGGMSVCRHGNEVEMEYFFLEKMFWV